MKKYHLIGVSIIAVVLLVLGSLTNVVGYQQVQSTAVNDSPLFSVRAKRAIKQTNGETLTSDYLERGIESNFQFPIRENRTERLQKCVDIIKKMDDKKFSRFQSLVVSRFYEDKNNKNINSIHVLSLLKQIRSNIKELHINQFDNNGNKNDPPSSFCGVTYGHSDLECLFLIGIIILILFVIIPILDLIQMILTIRNCNV